MTNDWANLTIPNYTPMPTDNSLNILNTLFYTLYLIHKQNAPCTYMEFCVYLKP